MNSFALFLWHASLGVLLLVIWRLTVRLGRAMRDDVGPIALFPVSAGLLFAAGIFSALDPSLPWAGWFWAGSDLLGAILGWYASWHSWGWLVGELRRSPG